MNTLGKRIKALRKKSGLSQIELGKIAGVPSQASVSQHETGDSKPLEKTLEKYASIFNVSIAYLRYGVEEKIETERNMSPDKKAIENLELEVKLLKMQLANIIDKVILNK